MSNHGLEQMVAEAGVILLGYRPLPRRHAHDLSDPPPGLGPKADVVVPRTTGSAARSLLASVTRAAKPSSVS